MSTKKSSLVGKDLAEIIQSHPFFSDLGKKNLNLVCGCAKNVRFKKNEFMLRTGEPANEFYLVRNGRIALEINIPGRPGYTFETVKEDEIVGVSWLVSPYRWSYDARVIDEVRAISIDARCLRAKCEEDNKFGYEMMTRFIPILVQRLERNRIQLLDLYSHNE